MNPISTAAARRLFLGAQGLLADPTRKATRATRPQLIKTAANGSPACVSRWHSVTAQATMPVTSAPETLACPAWNLCHELESN